MQKVLKSLKCYTIRIAAFKVLCRIIYRQCDHCLSNSIFFALSACVALVFVLVFPSQFLFVQCLQANWRPCQIVRCMRFNIYCAMGHKLYIKIALLQTLEFPTVACVCFNSTFSIFFSDFSSKARKNESNNNKKTLELHLLSTKNCYCCRENDPMSYTRMQ